MTPGLLLGTTPANERTFASFGLAMIPYFVFNAWFIVGPGRGVSTKWLFIDLIGNVTFALGSAYCFTLLKEQREENEGKKSL